MTDTRVPPDSVQIPDVLDKNNGVEPDIKIDSEPIKLRPLPGGRKTSASDSIPRRPRTTKKDSTPSAKPGVGTDDIPYKAGIVEEGMTNFYAQISMMVGMIRPRAGEVGMQNARAMAKSCERVAKESPQMRKVFDSLMTSSAWGEFATAHLPFATALAMDFIPAIQKRFNPQQPPQADGGTPPPMNTRTS
jgi:hypothetical protein